MDSDGQADATESAFCLQLLSKEFAYADPVAVQSLDALSAGVGAAISVKDMVKRVVPVSVRGYGGSSGRKGGVKTESERARKKALV